MGANAGLNSAGRVGQKRLSGKRLQGEIFVRLQASATPCRIYAPVSILAGLGPIRAARYPASAIRPANRLPNRRIRNAGAHFDVSLRWTPRLGLQEPRCN